MFIAVVPLFRSSPRRGEMLHSRKALALVLAAKHLTPPGYRQLVAVLVSLERCQQVKGRIGCVLQLRSAWPHTASEMHKSHCQRKLRSDI